MRLMKLNASICLASSSPRRRALLREAGYDVCVHPPDLDDGDLTSGRVRPEHWVMSLAYLKARRVLEALDDDSGPCAQDGAIAINSLVLAADTVCVVDNAILGQPVDADDARRMICAMADRAHRTITGVCILQLGSHRRHMSFDAATVRVGSLTDEQLDRYIVSGEWAGKAGAYNLADRHDAGWPIACDGDPTTVMGLPMQRLPRWIERVIEQHGEDALVDHRH